MNFISRFLARLAPYSQIRDAHDKNREEDEERNLMCMYCLEDGFQTVEELEEHIAAHDFTARRR